MLPTRMGYLAAIGAYSSTLIGSGMFDRLLVELEGACLSGNATLPLPLARMTEPPTRNTALGDDSLGLESVPEMLFCWPRARSSLPTIPEVRKDSGCRLILVCRAIDMVRGILYPSLPIGTLNPWTTFFFGLSYVKVISSQRSRPTMLQIARYQMTTVMTSLSRATSSRTISLMRISSRKSKLIYK